MVGKEESGRWQTMSPPDVFITSVMVPCLLDVLNVRLGHTLLPCILPRVFPTLPELRRCDHWQHVNHPGGCAFTISKGYGVKQWRLNDFMTMDDPARKLVDVAAMDMAERVEEMRGTIVRTIPELVLCGARFSQFDNGAANVSAQWKPDGSLNFFFRLHFEVRGWHFLSNGPIDGEMLSHSERWTKAPAT